MSKVAAFVPIKLNSQRLPHKNLLPMGGRAMCWHIFEALKKCENIDEIYVYCSEPGVMNDLPAGIRFLQRPAYLDGDEIKGAQIYEQFIREVDADIYVLAHATSPLVKATSIYEAVNAVRCGEYDSAFSVREQRTFAWFQGKPVNYSLDDVVRTQDLTPVYLETSAFFVFRREIFTTYGRRIGFHPRLIVLNHVEAVDVDTKSDYELAKYYMEGVSNENDCDPDTGTR